MIVFAINANGRSKDHIIRDKNREANKIRSEWTSCLDSTGRVVDLLCREDKDYHSTGSLVNIPSNKMFKSP